MIDIIIITQVINYHEIASLIHMLCPDEMTMFVSTDTMNTASVIKNAVKIDVD